LHFLGIFMGYRFIEPDETNPYGHWEDKDFVAINSMFLRGAAVDTCKELAKERIAERYRLGIPWGWKDPRTCDTLKYYLDFLDQPRFIRCRRVPEQIHASIMNAYGRFESSGWNWQTVERLQRQRDEALDRCLPGYDVLDIHFEQLLSNPSQIVRTIVQFTSVNDVRPDRVSLAISSIRQPTEAERCP
jgi:hypothetical protein